MTRTRWFDLAAVVAAAALVVGLGFALRPQDTATIGVNPSIARVDRPRPAADMQPSVLFIGDSYTAGGHGQAVRVSPEMSYSCMAAVKMGWLCKLSAVPGTGYICGGPANRFVVDPYIGKSTSFVERIPHLATMYRPEVVVLDGGRNDVFAPTKDVLNAMVATIEEARRAWPEAKLVFIRPRFLAKPDGDLGFDNEFMARLEAEPAAAGVVFIDPIARFTQHDTSAMLSSDGIHPNQEGEQELASVLVKSLEGHGFAEAS